MSNYINPLLNYGGCRGVNPNEFFMEVYNKLNSVIDAVNKLADAEGVEKLPFSNITFFEGEDINAFLTRINGYIKEVKGSILEASSVDADALHGDISLEKMDADFKNKITQIEADLIELADDLESGLLEKVDIINGMTFKGEIAIGENLNDVVTAGMHTQSSGESAIPTLNYPINKGGILIVYASGINTPQTTLIQCTQMYITNSNDEHGMFTRTLIGETDWGEWEEFMTTKTPLNMEQYKGIEQGVFDILRPVGSGVTFYDDTNPNEINGWFGTWVETAQGSVQVGYDVNDADFNTVGKMGGEKNVTLLESQLPRLSGSVGIHGSESGSLLASPSGVFSQSEIVNNMYKVPTQTGSGASSLKNLAIGFGGGLPHENMPPYIVVKHWKRIN